MLMQIKYIYGNEKKVFIAISLGIRNSKLVCLLDTSVSKPDANKIRKNAELLSKYTLEAKIAWVKNNIPGAYQGYREIYMSRLEIIKQYPLSKV